MTKVTSEQIKSLLSESEIEVKTIYDKTTLVTCKLPNGFVLVASSGAVSSANYSEEIGKEECMKRIEDELWKLEGYALAKDVAQQATKVVYDGKETNL